MPGRVVEQVGHNATNQLRRAENPACRHRTCVNRNVPPPGCLSQHYVVDVDLSPLRSRLPFFATGKDEEVFHNLLQAGALGQHAISERLHRCSLRRASRYLCFTAQHGDRRSELMARIRDELAQTTVINLKSVEHGVHRRGEFGDLVTRPRLRDPFVKVAAGDRPDPGGDPLHRSERTAGQQPGNQATGNYEDRHTRPYDGTNSINASIDTRNIGEDDIVDPVERPGVEDQPVRIYRSTVLSVDGFLLDPGELIVLLELVLNVEDVLEFKVDGEEDEFVNHRLGNHRPSVIAQWFRAVEHEPEGIELHDLTEIGEERDRLARLIRRSLEQRSKCTAVEQLRQSERETLEFELHAEVVNKCRLLRLECEEFDDRDELIRSRIIELIGDQLTPNGIDPDRGGDHPKEERNEGDQHRQPRPHRHAHAATTWYPTPRTVRTVATPKGLSTLRRRYPMYTSTMLGSPSKSIPHTSSISSCFGITSG